MRVDEPSRLVFFLSRKEAGSLFYPRTRLEGASTLPAPLERRAIELVVRWIHSTLVPPGRSWRGSVQKQEVERPDTVGDVDLPAVVGVGGVEAGRRLTSGE